METYIKNKLSWFTVCCVFCIPVQTSQAGILEGLSELVEPGGIEIPAVVNVLGPQDPNDVNNVKEIFRTANEILKQANVQFAVKWIKTGVTQFGDGDGLLLENEHRDVLLGSVIELERFPGIDIDNDSTDLDGGSAWTRRPTGPGKGIKFNIANDVWVERPELVFWHDIFYPVTFLESSVSPEQMGRILVREVGVTAGLSPSTDPMNFMHPDGEGTQIDESQKSWILGLARQVGHVRSPLAEGYVPEVLNGLHYKWPGALFFSEGHAIRSDILGDVLIEDTEGSRTGDGGVDLEAFIAKSGRIGASNEERSLVLKYYFGVGELPEDTYMDTYLRVPSHNKHGENGNGIPDGSPWETYDAVIGAGVTGSGPPFVGVINLLAGDALWIDLPGIQPEVDHDRGRTKVKIEIPLSVLTDHLPENLLECLNDGRGLELRVFANSFTFDSLGGFTFQDDSIDNIKLAPIPKPLPLITMASRYLHIDPATLSPGFDVRTTIIGENSNSPDEAFDVALDALRENFDQPFSGVEAGRSVYPWLNLSTTVNNDSFNSANGFPNDPYPGINLPNSTNLLLGIDAQTLIELPAGLHIFGLQGKDTAILQISPVKIGRLIHPNPDMQDGIDNGSNGDPVNGLPPIKGGQDDNHMGVLQRGDSAFEVKEPGLYLLKLRALSRIDSASSDEIQPLANGTSRASLELHQVLPDGTRVLLGDVTNGAHSVFIPPADIDVPDMPDEPDGTNGLFEGFETGIIDQSLWTFGGDTDWFASMEQANSGSYSAQAGPIGDNESTTMSFFGEFAAGGEISFWRKVSSEEGFDYLRFSINGEVLEEWSGEQDWEQVFFPAIHGSNTFEWIFIKDSSSDSGEDTVWIDDILFPPA